MWGRLYFAAQAAAGSVWWIAVFTSPFVREATLGSIDPVIVAVLDIPLFVFASAAAALGRRDAAARGARACTPSVWTTPPASRPRGQNRPGWP